MCSFHSTIYSGKSVFLLSSVAGHSTLKSDGEILNFSMILLSAKPTTLKKYVCRSQHKS